MKSIYAAFVSLAIFAFAACFSPPANAYVNITRSQALAGCEDTLAWERQTAPSGWVFHGTCRETSPSDPWPDYLGCYQAFGNYDIPSENNYNEDRDINDHCYGVDDDPAGKNAGPGGGCDGGEGGCFGGAADSGSPAVGDPVNTATGNKYVEETDYSDDPWLTFRRFYNSDPAASSSAMGMRWNHSFDRRIDRTTLFTGTSSITAFRPSGLRELFHKVATASVWTASPDNPDVLTESVDTQGNTTGYTLWIAALRHTETYSSDGRLLTIQDDTGQTETLTYSDSSTPQVTAPRPNLLITVTSPKGRTLAFVYDRSSRIRTMTLPDGGVVAYDYDYPGNLATVTYPDTKKRQYVYNESAFTGGAALPYAMTGVIDENGTRFETTSYDASQRATSTGSAGGAGKISIKYNTDGSSDVTFPLGGVSHQTYAKVQSLMRVSTLDKPCGECGQSFASRTYDANARPASYTDFNGNIRNVTYDANGLLTRDIEASGSADQRTTDTTWNTLLRKPLVRTVKDSSGRIVSKQGWAYNATGQVTAACLIDSEAAPSYTCSESGTAPTGVRRTVTTYCTTVDTVTCPLLGLILTTDGPRTDVSDTITYTWYMATDETGCAVAGGTCHRQGDLKSTTDGNGLVTTYLSYDKAGRVTRTSDPNGVLTDFTYTLRGWLSTKIIRANTSGDISPLDAITAIAYDPTGTIHSVTDADGVVTKYNYDDAHRLTDIIDAEGNRNHFVLDAAGNRVSEQVLDANNVVVRSLGRSFNTLGQLTAITDGLNQTVFSANFTDSYDANGNMVHSQDGLLVQQKQLYDSLNRLVSTIRDYQGSNTATSNAQTVTGLDALDRITAFSDPDSLNTSFDIDALGNVTGVHSPDTGTTIRRFDIAGNSVSSLDASNISASSTHDATGRLTATTYADASMNVSYRYDEADAVTGCTGEFGKGRLTRIIEGNGGLSYCYDRQGNVARKRQTVGSVTTTTDYTWTRANRLESVTTANGTVISYSRDNNGRINAVTATPAGASSKAMASNVTYQPFGPVASYTLGNGQTVNRTFDATGQLTDIASDAFSLHLKRDVMGNVIAFGEAAGVAAPTETYIYDSLYRLTTTKDGYGTTREVFTYNKTGDRLSKTASGLLTGTYSYKSDTHQLIAAGTTSREVDSRGNTTTNVLASGTLEFGYNQRNRLATVRKDGMLVSNYLVNAEGQRVQKDLGSRTSRYDYTETGQLISESTEDSSRDYVWLDNIPIGTVDRTDSTPSVAFIVTDDLGTPRSVSNTSGALLWQWGYQNNPFGEMEPVSSTDYTLNLRFPGQYFDAESGMSYNLGRDYEAASGRYLQSDPIGLGAGSDTYSYVGGNPYRYIDPEGLNAALIWGGFWEGFVGGAEAGGEAGAEGGTAIEPGGGTLVGGLGGAAVGGLIGGAIGAWGAYSKGGSQNIENEYSREARRQPDPCDWLDEQYATARSAGDTVAAQKIVKAQKALGCRNKKKRCER